MPITLRLRGPGGTASLTLASADSTLGELRDKVFEQSNIPVPRQDIRLGFPPKPLPASAQSESTLDSLGITNGEPIIVAELSEDRPQSPTGAVAPTPAPPAPASKSPPIASTLTPPVPAPPPPEPITVKSSGVEYVEVNGGFLVLRVVPDDNACLFRAVGLVLDPSRTDSAAFLRNIVAEAIRADPETWSEPVLCRSPSSYIAAITQKETWGGAIELSILAKYFTCEICSVDVLTGRIDRFGSGEGYKSQVLVVYSGIHYDALTFSYSPPTPATTFPPPNIDFDQTSFATTNDSVVDAAATLVARLRAAHRYTDTSTFTLKCEECGKALVGEKDARGHARETGHSNFGEYDG